MPRGRRYGRFEQSAERSLRIHLCPENHCSDKHADEIVEGLIPASADRGADRDVGLPRHPRQQYRQRRVQHHERCGPSAASQGFDGAVRLRREGRRHRRTSIGRDCGMRPIRREIETGRDVRQCSAPVFDLARCLRFRIVLVAERIDLPERVVRVVNAQRRPLWRGSREP